MSDSVEGPDRQNLGDLYPTGCLEGIRAGPRKLPPIFGYLLPSNTRIQKAEITTCARPLRLNLHAPTL